MKKQDSPIQTFVDKSEMFVSDHMPIVARMCQKIGLIDTINENIPCNTDIDPGTLVVGMICDTLSGRSPLYKVEDFIKTQDTEILFGSHIDSKKFNDDALGKTLDRIHKAGTHQLFTKLSLNAAAAFNLDLSTCNFDTTSVNVWGEYRDSNAKEKNSTIPKLTYGYSKDKRPDLKQFMVSMLCVEGNIPLSAKMQNGNSSDEKLNNEELQRLSKLLSPLGKNLSEITYVADCKLINSNNMSQLEQLNFISRFPAIFKQHDQLIAEALDKKEWENLGILAQTPSNSKNRPPASYKSQESLITINGKNYRGIVIQTDHLNKHRTKSIDARHAKAAQQTAKQIKALTKTTYHCQHDAQAALEKLTKKKKNAHFNLTGILVNTPIYARGRTPKNGERKITGRKFTLALEAEENTAYLTKLRQKAGCFVMITNHPKSEKSAGEILKTYKGQYGIEQNFSFLKDPLIVNDTFLKTPSRIEALTLILVVSLMIWNLIQRELRNSATCEEKQLRDLNKKITTRPTSYLLKSHLKGTIILKHGHRRYLPKNGLSSQSKAYLQALNLDETIYLIPPAKSKTQRQP